MTPIEGLVLSRACKSTAERKAVLRASRLYLSLDDDKKKLFSPKIIVRRPHQAASKDSFRLHFALWVLLRAYDGFGALFFSLVFAFVLYLFAFGVLIHNLLR